MTVALPPGLVTAGINTVNFKFNGTDGNSSGFRVLAFNIQESNGTQLIPSTAFAQDNPASWTIPLNDAADIAAGQTLWSSATIKQPVSGGSPTTLQAHCGDCHTADGRDLKYFNYSNNAIETRAAFHGLNSAQGAQIASYIRSLSTPAPATARPWNPPYQPGPGLDSQPVADWAAGAGVGAVVASDQQMLTSVSPNLATSDFNAQNYLNMRQVPIAFQLPDWNHWLPRVHPLDVWGSNFTQSASYSDYQSLKLKLAVSNPSIYVSEQGDIANWDDATTNFENDETAGFINNSSWTYPQTNSIYSLGLWRLVKHWELLQEFQLEGFGQQWFGTPKADARAWPDNTAFMTSPNMLHIPPGSPGVANGDVVTFDYFSLAWYQLEMIQDSGNGSQNGSTPIDWGYVYGFMKDLNQQSQAPSAMLLMAWLQKGLQNAAQLNTDITQGQAGWFGTDPDISRMVHYDFNAMWNATPSATRAELMQAYASNWLISISRYSLGQLYASGYISPNDSPAGNSSGGNADGSVADKLYYSIPRLRYYGVGQSTVNNLANWAQTVWPGTNWSVLTTQTCSPAGNPGSLTCQ